MIRFHRLLPFLAVAAWAGVAHAQVPDRRAATLGAPDTRPAAEAGEIQVTDVTLREGRLGLVGPDRTRVDYLPSGVYTSQVGDQIVIEDGAIRRLGRDAVRSTMVTSEGVRLRMVDGRTVAIPDGTYLGGPDTGSLTISSGRPSRFRLPGVEQGVHDQENQPNPVAREVQRRAEVPGVARSDVAVLVARGVGARATADRLGRPVTPLPEPLDLTLSETNALLEFAGVAGLLLTAGSNTWVLTPAQALIPNRALLTASDVYLIYGSGTSLVYGVGAGGKVALWFTPPQAGRNYLVDCKVSGAAKYRVDVYPGGATQTFENTDHLVVMYEAVSGEQVSMTMSAEPPDDWSLWSCQVSQLD